MLSNIIIERLDPVLILFRTPICEDALVSIFCIWILGVIASLLLTIGRQKSASALWANIFAEFIAFLLFGIGWIMPTTTTRFVVGLLTSCNFLTIHARVCDSFAKSKTLAEGGFVEQFKAEFFKTQTLLVSTHASKITPSLPSVSEISSLLLNAHLLELTNYGIREYVPYYIEQKWQFLFTCILGMNWILFSMNLNYDLFIIVPKLFGYEVPVDYRHVHPSLSTSFFEFWSVRWNPITGRALKCAYYNPLRRLGVPRVLCVIACFTGSALLHCIPQYFSTYSWKDSLMMFSFFVLHGVIFLAEAAIQEIWKPKRLAGPRDDISKEHRTAKPAVADNSKSGEVSAPQTVKLLAFQTLTEVAQTFSFVAVPYFLLVRPEDSSPLATAKSLSVSLPSVLLPFASPSWELVELTVPVSVPLLRWVAIALVALAITGFVLTRVDLHVRLQQRNETKQPLTAEFLLRSTGSWLLSVAVILMTVPLFVLPALNACREVYPRSFVLGAVIEASAAFVKLN